MGTSPVVADDGQEPVGSRLTLVFDKYVPDITPDQFRALIQPVMDFNVKTPLEAYVNTLPPKLKEAILAHHVLVGMDRKMVIYALGQPRDKVREQDNGVPFEEWIYRRSAADDAVCAIHRRARRTGRGRHRRTGSGSPQSGRDRRLSGSGTTP